MKFRMRIFVISFSILLDENFSIKERDGVFFLKLNSFVDIYFI